MRHGVGSCSSREQLERTMRLLIVDGLVLFMVDGRLLLPFEPSWFLTYRADHEPRDVYGHGPSKKQSFIVTSSVSVKDGRQIIRGLLASTTTNARCANIDNGDKKCRSQITGRDSFNSK